jgi:hypothetical protein
MEYIQGVAIPRCYGFFQTRLPEDGMHVKPWLDKGHTVQNTLISVLVLERVGGHLTMPMKFSEEDK